MTELKTSAENAEMKKRIFAEMQGSVNQINEFGSTAALFESALEMTASIKNHENDYGVIRSTTIKQKYKNTSQFRKTQLNCRRITRKQTPLVILSKAKNLCREDTLRKILHSAPRRSE